MSASPLCTVVITTYYRNDLLRRAIDSALNQSHQPLEVIVVDDSGEAHAEPATKDYPEVTYIPKDANDGPHVARDVGIRASAGAYVQLLDDDDELMPSKLEKQGRLLEANESVGVAYCGVEMEDGSIRLPDPDVRGEVLEHMLAFEGYSPTSTLLIEREVLLEVLPFSDRYGGADDMAMKIDLADATRFDYVDEALVKRNQAEENWGASWEAVEGRERIIRDYRGLYDQFDSAVLHKAMAQTSLRRGWKHSEESVWSLRAIKSYARALYYSPGFDPFLVATFLASLFGRPGFAIGNRLNAVLNLHR